MHSLCRSVQINALRFLRYGLRCIAVPSRRCALRSLAVPLPFVAWPCSAYLIYAMPLLIGATPCDSLALPSKPCQSFAKMFQAMQCLCGSARFTARPCLSVHCSALLILCHSTPRLCFSPPCCAMRFLCFSLLCRALRFLCFSMQRYSLPINSFAGRFTAMMFCCSSIRFPAVPILCRSTLGYALPLLCCPAHCLAILCFALARLFRRLRPRGSGPCRSCATGQGPGNIRSPATRVPVSGPFHPYR